MSVAFMALLALALEEEFLLWPLVAAGAASVVSWRITGDLRPYGLVQFFPMLALPALLLLDRAQRGRGLMSAMLWYAAAKLLELLDAQVFAIGHIVSGHTLKHLAATASTACLLGYVARRPGVRGRTLVADALIQSPRLPQSRTRHGARHPARPALAAERAVYSRR
jgi:hypothetical protein